jgi:SnoaL-like domain
MSDLSTTIDTYLEAYCETDAARRDELVARAWAENGELIDPPLDASGRSAISALADVVDQHYPGHTFRRTSGIDAHHDRARYAWELVGADGTVAVTGVDTVELDDDGQLVRVVGFFGDLPAREG